jgi:hypothetical protein
MKKRGVFIQRYCAKCRTKLSSDNKNDVCSPCMQIRIADADVSYEPTLPEFYDFTERWLGSIGPRGEDILVLDKPIRQSKFEKIVDGTVPPHYVGNVRLPKNTEEVWLRPAGTLMVSYFEHRKRGHFLRIHSYADTLVPTQLICKGDYSNALDYTWDYGG